MTTLEITIQPQTADSQTWRVLADLTEAGNVRTRREGELRLTVADLLSQSTPRDYGMVLGQALFHDKVWVALSQAMMHDDLRLWLTIDDPKLKQWQWQRLCAPVDDDWDFLSLQQRLLFSQYIPTLSDRRFPMIGRKDLRALVVVAKPTNLSHYGLSDFDEAQTVAQIQQALGEIPHTVLTTNSPDGLPTMSQICEQLTRQTYTMLHLVAHGKQSDKGNLTLFLADAQNQAALTSAEDFMRQLGRVQSLPRFMFLSVCDSANPTAEGLGQQLVQKLGIRHVIAMTDLVSINSAETLARDFYPRLSEHGEVDRALGQALTALFKRHDVTVPALFTCAPEWPLFSDTLDRELTAMEMAFGLDRLADLLVVRAPTLQVEFEQAEKPLRSTLKTQVKDLSQTAQLERHAALSQIQAMSEEAIELTFNALALGKEPPDYDERCPFQGLTAFQAEHKEFFFGRESVVQTLQAKLSHHFLAVLGPSGCGKSSVVLAGLVPTLGYPWARMVPGNDPILQLEAALARLRGQTEGQAMLVVDQFEEVFTLCRDEAKRRDFFDKLLQLADLLPPSVPPESGGKKLDVVITMRADFWGECASYRALKEAMQGHQELIAPMSAAELHEAMLQQARAVGLRFEADLSQTILAEVANEPGAMPLLQHALWELWARRHGRWLRAAEYRALGGVQQALAQTAEKVYHRLSAPQQQAMRQILTRLTRLDDEATSDGTYRDTRRRLPVAALVPTVAQTAEYRQLMSELASARLVVTQENQVSHAAEVEVTHEALIRHWARLREWLSDNRAMLLARQEVEAQAMRWQTAPRDHQAEYLTYRGSRLLELQAWQSYFNHVAQDYVRACASHELAQAQTLARRFRLAVGFGLLATIAALVAVWFGYQSNQNAELAFNNQETAVAERDNAEAQKATAESERNNALIQKVTAEAAHNEAETQKVTAEAERNNAQIQKTTAEAANNNALIQKATAVAAKETSVAERNNAEANANLANARDLLNQARQVLEEKPLLALRLVMESEAIAPLSMKDNVHTTLLSFMNAGHIAKLGQNIVKIYATPLTHTVIISYANQLSVIQDWNTGQVFTLSGQLNEYDKVFYSFENKNSFVVMYKNIPGELWLQQGQQVITLNGEVSYVYYSPENNGDFVVNYQDAPDELRLQHGQQVIPLSRKVKSVYYSPENTGDFVVIYDDGLSELRLQHSQQVISLNGLVWSVYYSPEKNGDFVVDYQDVPDELRLQHGQQIITLTGNIKADSFGAVYYSSKNNGDFIIKYDNILPELRLQHDQQVITFDRMIDKVYYSSENNGDFVVNYYDTPAELWLQESQRVITLNGHVNEVHYSPENNGDFVVDYQDAPDELRLQHGQQIITLTGNINILEGSSQGTYFLVQYKNLSAEVWRWKQARQLIQLGLGLNKNSFIFDEPNDRLIVWYSDGRAYLLDLAMLGAIQPKASLDELKYVVCETLHRNEIWLNEEEVKPYLSDMARACQ